jgi:4-amino-4-deoxy-L-arabinose transferase-like glycosyltransferase
MKGFWARPTGATLLVVALAVMLRTLFAANTGLGIDESYMVAASNRFSASYFDHPLVSWWLELASRRVFGGESPIVVRLPFVALSAVSSWLLFVLTRRLYGGRAAFWAVAAYSVSPVFCLAFGCWVLPDGPLDAALLAAAYALTRALGVAETAQPAEPNWWLAAGLFVGVALLSKYNAVLTLAGAGLLLLSDPLARTELRRWQFAAGGLLAVMSLAPVLVWNAAHGWQSLHYQGGRAAGLRLHPLAPFGIWGGEALFVLPWIWLPMVGLLLRALRRGPGERQGWMLAMLALPPILLFALIGIWSSTRILYHWATPGYLLLFAPLGDWAAGFRPRLRNAVAVVSAGLLVAAAMLIAAEIRFGVFRDLDLIFPPGKSPLLQAVDWTSLRGEIDSRDVSGVAALRWYDAGKIGYALRGDVPVTVFGLEPHEFGIATPPTALLGRDILLLAMPGDISQITRQYAPYFKSLEPAPALTVLDHGHVLLVIPVLLGHDLLAAPR